MRRADPEWLAHRLVQCLQLDGARATLADLRVRRAGGEVLIEDRWVAAGSDRVPVQAFEELLLGGL